ncbi:MAG: hypothetical protein ACFFEV_10705 [Candidatus Thorarchaeota archaeon]
MQTAITTTSGGYPTSPSPIPMINTSVIGTVFFFVVIIGLFIYVVKRNIQSQKGSDFSTLKPNPIMLMTSIFIIALFAPSDIFIYFGLGPFDSSIQLFGMSWQFALLPDTYLMFDFIFFLVGSLLTCFRIVFVYYVYKYYLGKTTRKRVTIVGILAELQLPLISLAMLPVGLTNPFVLVLAAIPIPILLIVGLVVLRVVPPYLVPSDWEDLDDGNEWWEKEKEETSVLHNE